jgi:hypothetical protein
MLIRTSMQRRLRWGYALIGRARVHSVLARLLADLDFRHLGPAILSHVRRSCRSALELGRAVGGELVGAWRGGGRMAAGKREAGR